MQGKEAEEPERSRVFVANESSNTVTVVDGDTFQVVGTVDARNHATHDLAVSRDGRWLFATNLASGRLSAINTRTMETVASIATGDRAHVVTLTNDNRQAWVANIGENTISIVDTTTFRILGTIAVGKGPTGPHLLARRPLRLREQPGRQDGGGDRHRLAPGPEGDPGGDEPALPGAGPRRAHLGDQYRRQRHLRDRSATQDKVASINVGPAPQQIAFGFKGLQGPNAYVTVAGRTGWWW